MYESFGNYWQKQPTGRNRQKILFLKGVKISLNSQENTYDRVSFLIKLQAEAYNFITKETLTKVPSCEFWEIFKNTARLLLYWAVRANMTL